MTTERAYLRVFSTSSHVTINDPYRPDASIGLTFGVEAWRQRIACELKAAVRAGRLEWPAEPVAPAEAVAPLAPQQAADAGAKQPKQPQSGGTDPPSDPPNEAPPPKAPPACGCCTLS